MGELMPSGLREGIVETEWAYLAGVIDADGSVGIQHYGEENHKHFKPYIDVCGDRLMMSWLVAHIADTYIYQAENCWQWKAMRRQLVTDILDHILPYVVTKRKEAVIVREFLTLPHSVWCREDKETFVAQLKELRARRMEQKWIALGKLKPEQECLVAK